MKLAWSLSASTLTTDAQPLESISKEMLPVPEEVEGHRVLQVQIAIEHVEDVFLGEISGRTGLERAWYVEMTALIEPCDNSHLPLINKVIRSSGRPFICVIGARLKLCGSTDDKGFLHISLQSFCHPVLLKNISREI